MNPSELHVHEVESTEISIPSRRSDLLKLIAIVTMVTDHVGVLLFPELRILRTIGRIAFPIFAWLLVQGFLHTSSRTRYGLRFLVFALISQVPYMFLNRDMIPEYLHFNVMFLLLLGLILLVSVERCGMAIKEGTYRMGILWGVLSMVIVSLPDLVQYQFPDFAISYGTYGLIMILIFYWAGNHPVITVIAYMALSISEPYRVGVYYRSLYISPEMTYGEAFSSTNLIWQQISEYKDGFRKLEGYFFQARSILGLASILLLKNLPIPIRIPTYAAYAFYPVHIIVLLLIRILNGGPLV